MQIGLLATHLKGRTQLHVRTLSPYGPIVCTFGVIALLIAPVSWYYGNLSEFSLAVAAPLSAAIIGVLSAFLWLRSAWVDGDKLSNAAAAGFSGAAAIFGAGSISFPKEMSDARPEFIAGWPIGAYGFGWIVVSAVLITAWRRYRRS